MKNYRNALKDVKMNQNSDVKPQNILIQNSSEILYMLQFVNFYNNSAGLYSMKKNTAIKNVKKSIFAKKTAKTYQTKNVKWSPNTGQ